MPSLGNTAYLEREPGPNLIRKNLGHHPVKGRENLHRQLWFNAAFVDQVIKGIGQRLAEASHIRSV